MDDIEIGMAEPQPTVKLRFEVEITAPTEEDAQDMYRAMIDAAIDVSNSYEGYVTVFEETVEGAA